MRQREGYPIALEAQTSQVWTTFRNEDHLVERSVLE